MLSRDLGRTWPISVRMRKKSECLGVEKETTCRRRRYCSQQIAATEEPHRRIYVGRAEMTRPCCRPRRGATELDYASFNAATYTNLLEEAGSEGLFVARTAERPA